MSARPDATPPTASRPSPYPHTGPAGAADAARAPLPPSTGRRSRARRLLRGRPEDPRWARPAFLGLLAATLALYVWNLSASGYANSFYSAAVQAGSQSWKAFFFGSLDAGNAITVDKPPAALWPMALSVRVFGLSSWAILLPEVLMGVGTVAVVYAAVRRRTGPVPALLAGAVTALTPVAALMFRFNNPDALLTLLMTVACYLVARALEDGRTRWLLWAGAAIGLAFLTKTLQAFLILPPLALVYAVCAPVPLRRRLTQLALATGALVVSGGWWSAAVELWPADSRPYIGGSQNNSFLELTFGYNGLGRLNGEETGSVGGGGGGYGFGGGGAGGGRWGETGWSRMFGDAVGAQVSWLLPAALVLLVAGLLATRRGGLRARRGGNPAATPGPAPALPTLPGGLAATRGTLLVWGGALLITVVVFSYMAGIFHEYYTVALAPYIAVVVGVGAGTLWERRTATWASLALATAAVAAAVWGYVLLTRAPDHLPWLRWLVLTGGLAGALGLVFAGRLPGRLALGSAAVAVLAGLAGPTAYTLSTVDSAHTGSIPTAGPAAASQRGGGGRGGPGGGFPGGGPGGGQAPQAPPGQNLPAPGTAPGGTAPGGTAPGGTAPDNGETGARGGGGGGMGGLIDGVAVSSEARALLKEDADRYTWAAAAIGSQNAASYQLSSDEPVMAIGGFNGTDPSPTLAQFQQYVAEGRVHYFLAEGDDGRGGRGGDDTTSTSARITAWVEATYTKVTVGSATFYDLTQKASD
ncbi:MULTISPECIES: glycosyltransferase family 39 protein [unclassified Streptomyces]|uniref:glycosyltransferase family 39 protein n=1 Tax=unclassified Streptomyces TaxID=2593676 RepID=UPI0038007D8A